MKKLIILFLLIPSLCFAGTLQDKIKTVIAAIPKCTAQTITWNTQPAAMAVEGADQTLNQASASSSLTVAYTTDTTSYCTVVSGPKLHAVSAGTCVVHANQAGNGTYCAASNVNSENITIAGVSIYQFGVTDANLTNFDYRSGGGYATATKFTGNGKTISCIKVASASAIHGPGASGHVMVAIHGDNGSGTAPAARLAYTNTSTAITAYTPTCVALDTPYTTTNGTVYWLSFLADADGVVGNNSLVGPGIYYHTDTYAGFEWPSTFPSGTSLANYGNAIAAWGY